MALKVENIVKFSKDSSNKIDKELMRKYQIAISLPKHKTSNCKFCKKAFVKENPLVPYCSPRCASKKEEEKRKSKKNKVKEKFGTVASAKTLKAQADRAMSDYIRERDGWKCVICGETGKHIQNGHYIPRQSLALRYDETNCHAQCPTCNGRHNLDREPYRLYIVRRYWEEKLLEFSEKAKILTKWSKLFFLEKKIYFLAKLNK